MCRHFDVVLPTGAAVPSWVWPHTVDGIQRGDDLMVYAEMADDRSHDTARVVLSGPVSLHTDVPLNSPIAKGLRPLVERAWARARIVGLPPLR
jgi:hypothetical protein